jgi:hypothetical protein
MSDIAILIGLSSDRALGLLDWTRMRLWLALRPDAPISTM